MKQAVLDVTVILVACPSWTLKSRLVSWKSDVNMIPRIAAWNRHFWGEWKYLGKHFSNHSLVKYLYMKKVTHNQLSSHHNCIDEHGRYCERRERQTLYSRVFIIGFQLYADNFLCYWFFFRLSTDVYGLIPFKYEYFNIISEICMHIRTSWFALSLFYKVVSWFL